MTAEDLSPDNSPLSSEKISVGLQQRSLHRIPEIKPSAFSPENYSNITFFCKNPPQKTKGYQVFRLRLSYKIKMFYSLLICPHFISRIVSSTNADILSNKNHADKT